MGYAYPHIVGSLPPRSGEGSQDLLHLLSYSHFEELVAIEDPLKRAFYKRGMHPRELVGPGVQRQIAGLYYERTALLKDEKRLARTFRDKAEPISPAQVIRDPYIFEFLGLHPHEALSELNLEGQLIDRLQEFLLELAGASYGVSRSNSLLGSICPWYFPNGFLHRKLSFLLQHNTGFYPCAT